MSKTLKHLIAKAILDKEFKKKLIGDFEATAKSEGVQLTAEQLKGLKKIKESDWDQIEAVLGDSIIPTSACRVT